MIHRHILNINTQIQNIYLYKNIDQISYEIFIFLKKDCKVTIYSKNEQLVTEYHFNIATK